MKEIILIFSTIFSKCSSLIFFYTRIQRLLPTFLAEQVTNIGDFDIEKPSKNHDKNLIGKSKKSDQKLWKSCEQKCKADNQEVEAADKNYIFESKHADSQH